MNTWWRGTSKVLRTLALAGVTLTVLGLGVLALRAPGDGSPVWVTTRDIELGGQVTGKDLQLVTVPAAALPDLALPAQEGPPGFVAARFLPARTVLTQVDVRGSERARLLAADETLVEVTARTGSFTPGDMVDVWGQAADCVELACPPTLIAAEARVLQQAETPGWTEAEGVLLSLAVPASATADVLWAAQNGTLSLTLRPG